ncbi:hypothetical protein Acr_00g0062260 [Actinidia rufa]|uniref:Uncharacterized protein n=1 Tax=Actinidia rufa TaxID=165716 RepID=A0A7J0DP54_9ERIC|nr:hypothetical protein Acr_00g0062260 [Actinidia rufa]
MFSPSAAIRNKNGDNGSPCLNPLSILKSFVAEPLTRTDMGAVIMQASPAVPKITFHARKQVAEELERQVANLKAQEQHTIDELKRMKQDHDATMAKLEKEMAELKKEFVLAKWSAVEEFKSSDEFHEVVKWATSRFYGKGFDLCKLQIRRLHPDLNIQDLQIDVDLGKEEEGDEEEKGEKEEEKAEIDDNPPPK